MALTDNLQAYYKLDESSGNASDSSGNGYTLTNNGTFAYSAAKINNGFDGGSANSTKFGSSATSLGMSMATNFTYNFWINVTTLPTAGNVQTPLHWGDATTANQKGNVQLQLYNNGGTQELYILRQDSAGNDQQGGAYTLTAGTWFMLTYVWDGSNHKLFINGSGTPTLTQASTRTGTNTASGSYGTKTEIGADSTNARYLSGLIDEAGVWSRVLSSAEITELYNSGNGKQYPFGIAYSIIASVGTFTLTGIAVGLYRGFYMATSVGSFVLTGISAILSKGFGIVAEVGAFVLTGVNVVLRASGARWTNQSKNTSSWTNQTKNTSSWSNQSKS